MTISSPRGLSRRGFIRFSAAGALLLSAACAPSTAPSASGSKPTAGAGAPSASGKSDL